MPTQSAAAVSAQRVVNWSTDVIAKSRGMYQGSKNMIWNNGDGLTPQQFFDALGTQSVAFLTVMASIAAAANGCHAASIDTTTPKALTLNADGTVTVAA